MYTLDKLDTIYCVITKYIFFTQLVIRLCDKQKSNLK